MVDEDAIPAAPDNASIFDHNGSERAAVPAFHAGDGERDRRTHRARLGRSRPDAAGGHALNRKAAFIVSRIKGDSLSCLEALVFI